jgi:RimJ/RimL family protein N-acetyltransferase
VTSLSVTLVGEHTTLAPLAIDDLDGLVAAATQDRSSYTMTHVPDTIETMGEQVRHLLAEGDEGVCVPFTTRAAETHIIVGMTRFMTLRWWFDRDVPDAVEIGGTFLSSSAQGTLINTDAKYLMLRHAFEVWSVLRVDLKTDARNQRSRKAIERIGGQFEGVLRQWQPSLVTVEQGQARDSAMYSILSGQWPDIRGSLERRMRG